MHLMENLVNLQNENTLFIQKYVSDDYVGVIRAHMVDYCRSCIQCMNVCNHAD